MEKKINKEELIDELFLNKLKIKKEEENLSTEDVLKRTYIKVKLSGINFSQELDIIYSKLSEFEGYKKQLKELGKKKVELRTQIIKNLEFMRDKLKKIYLLLLSSTNSEPPVIIEKKEVYSNKLEMSEEKRIREKVQKNGVKLTEKLDERNEEEPIEEKILLKLEEELKKLEQELQLSNLNV